jgi:hypothetical protein
MTIKKRVRRVDLIFKAIIALYQQLLREFLGILRVLESLEKRQRVKSEPDLRRVAIDLVNRTQQSGQSRCPGFFIVLFKVTFELCTHTAFDNA